MCGGNKGQATQNTNQTQTYTPNPQAAGYITSALDRAQQTANLPFNIPVAPVAGFSQDQQNAFNTVNQAQGAAQPYYSQAANLYNQGATGSNISNFFNPYASAVTDNLKDIFGSQMSQTTGQLTQAAGGVGADRIAVGQSELAKQQGLAAGQTLASLYQPALQASQSAAFNGAQGLAGVGQGMQNAALQGAQAQLGTGGLQQQLSQAQLNAPYQQQVAQAAFPYQQAQFYGSLVGALAPGLGGTTTGQSNTTSTPAQPSIWSQLLGGAGALAGGLGATGAFGSNGWLTGASQPGIGNSYGGYSPYGGSYGTGSYGGISYPAFAEGGGVDDDPIDIAAHPFIPQSQLVPIKPNIPQLQQPPSQGGGGGGQSGGGIGDLIGSVAKVLPFFLERGGAVNPYASGAGYAGGGTPTDEERELGYDLLRRGLGVKAPDTIPGGEAPPIVPAAPAEEPFRMPSEEAVQAWRDGADRDRSMGLTSPSLNAAAGPSQRPVSMDIPTDTPMSYAPQGNPNTAGLPPEVISGRSKADNPYATSGVPNAPQSEKTLADNPWMSLLAAGLGIMGGTSPFAGVNIGQGGQQGLKMLQQQKESAQKDTTIAQAARRLEQEAKFHEDQYSRVTMGQKQAAEIAKLPYEKMTVAQREAADRAEEAAKRDQSNIERKYSELTAAEKAADERAREAARLARVPQGFRQKEDGSLEYVPGGSHDPEQIKRENEARRVGTIMSDEDLRPLIDTYKKGNTAGVLSSISRGTQGSQNIARFWSLLAQDLQAEGKTGADLAATRADFMAQSAAARVSAQREANIQTAVNEARGTFPEVLRTSEALPRTNFVPYNKVLEIVRTNTGSPEQRQYAAAIQAAVTAYSQAMSRTGTNSVYAQQHAADVISRADGHQAIKASIAQLEREMKIALEAPEQTRRGIIDKIVGAPGAAHGSATAPAGAAAAPARSAQDQQALEWATANPNDPRAAAIKKRLGVQ